MANSNNSNKKLVPEASKAMENFKGGKLKSSGKSTILSWLLILDFAMIKTVIYLLS